MKISVSPSSRHCRTFLTLTSVVTCVRSEPSRLTSHISLLATKAILSAPPNSGAEGGRVGVAVSVGSTGSVLVGSTTSGTAVASLTAVEVSVAGGAEVDVLSGASVCGGVRVWLKRKKPPARAAIAMIGTMTKSALNDLF